MRKLLVVTAAYALAALTAHAESPPPAVPSSGAGIPGLSFGGHARYRVEGDEFQDFNTLRSFSQIRVRPNFTYQIDEQTKAVFEPQFAKIFGERPLAPSTASANAVQQTSGISYDTPVGFHQGYLAYRPNSTFEFFLGRQILGYGEEIVIGAADWGPIGRSFDAVRTRASYGRGFTDVFVSKLADTNTNSNGPGDSTLYGIYTTQDFGPYLKAADLYLLFLRNASGQPHQDVRAVGLRLKSGLEDLPNATEGFRKVLSRFDYRLELTVESGSAAGNGKDAFQGDAELGYTAPGARKLRLAYNAEIAGRNYNQLFASPHRWYGIADLFGRRNITNHAIRLSSLVVGDLGAQLDYNMFTRTSAGAPAYRTDGTTVLGGNSTSTSKDLGSELDLILRYKLTRTLLVTAGGSIVRPGDFLRGQYGAQNPKFYYLSVEAKF